MKRFPRVLVVTKSQINDLDSAGAALRNWFKAWPRDHLAQLFSGVAVQRDVFCGDNFQLGPDERSLGRVFFQLKGSALGESAQPYRCQAGDQTGIRARLAAGARGFGKALIESGLWELIFVPRLSARLRSWIEAFRPEVMFVQGCDISFMRLPLLIHEAYRIPICFSVVDDWVSSLYASSVVRRVMQKIVRDTFRDLAAASALRLTIGEMMAGEYTRRYGLAFEPLMQCDDHERFANAPTGCQRAGRRLNIVYSGSLALGRWKALLDLADACRQLGSRGRALEITAYAPFVPPEAEGALRAAPHLTVKEAAADQDVPGILAAADVLFLPESFDESVREHIRLSVSTKAHLYMMASRPALVYGPAQIGTVEYARRAGWGHVVDREGPEALAPALEQLLDDAPLRQRLLENARSVSHRNHLGSTVRERLRGALLATCS